LLQINPGFTRDLSGRKRRDGILRQMPQREPFRFQTRIRFIDTDASGRIHYTSMFRYFESAEIELLRTVGITYESRRSYAFPRVHVECDFMQAIAHDDLIEIETLLVKLGRSSVHFKFRTFKDAVLAATGSVVVACVDRDTQRAIALPEDVREKLVAILDAAQS
jgi:acyl-CoA thioester hydrolase